VVFRRRCGRRWQAFGPARLRKDTSRRHPVFLARICAAGVCKPHLAESISPRGAVSGREAFGGRSRQRLVEQFENSFARRHGGLQNIEFFAQVLDGPEEALRELHKVTSTPTFTRRRTRATRRTRTRPLSPLC